MIGWARCSRKKCFSFSFDFDLTSSQRIKNEFHDLKRIEWLERKCPRGSSSPPSSSFCSASVWPSLVRRKSGGDSVLQGNPCLTLSAASVVNLRASNVTCQIVVRSEYCTIKFYGFLFLLKRRKNKDKFKRQYYETFQIPGYFSSAL